MDTASEIRDFLTSRRARVRPEQVELPGGPGRRVPGLRRSEVARLAGVGVSDVDVRRLEEPSRPQAPFWR